MTQANGHKSPLPEEITLLIEEIFPAYEREGYVFDKVGELARALRKPNTPPMHKLLQLALAKYLVSVGFDVSLESKSGRGALDVYVPSVKWGIEVHTTKPTAGEMKRKVGIYRGDGVDCLSFAFPHYPAQNGLRYDPRSDLFERADEALEKIEGCNQNFISFLLINPTPPFAIDTYNRV